MKKAFFLALLSIILLSSCVVSESLTTTTGYSGSSKTNLTVDDFFLSVLEDFSSFNTGEGYSIMDDAMVGFSNKVHSSENASSVNLLSDGSGKRYILSFDYSSLSGLMKDLNNGEDNSLLKVTEKSLAFNLSMDNYSELKNVIPFLSDKNFEVYGPEYSNGMTEDEYMDMISFLLGEDSPEALNNSLVTIEITTPQAITKISGAMKNGTNKAVFSFPVIDFLLLNEPISFSIEWK